MAMGPGCKNCGEKPLFQLGLCFGCFNDPHYMEPHA